MTNAVRKLSGTYWPVLIAFAAILIVMLFLFAYPLVSGALGFALPFVTMAVMASVFLAINLRWSLWHGGRPLFFSIADTGFLLCAAAIGVFGFAFVSDYGWNVPYVLIGLGVIAIFRVTFIEFEAWWLGIVLCALLALVFGAYAKIMLFEPSWFFDFAASLLLVTGLLLLLTGSVLLLTASPEGSRREGFPAWLRAGAIVLALGLTAALLASAVLTLANRETVPGAQAQGLPNATFDAGRLELSTSKWQVGPVTLVVENRDLRAHSFTSDELGIDVMLGPRSQRTVQFYLPVGDFGLVCRIPGHSERAGISAP